jgi:hypothetical protein
MRIILIAMAAAVAIAAIACGFISGCGRSQPAVPALPPAPAAGAPAVAVLGFATDLAGAAPAGWTLHTHGPGRPPRWTVVQADGVGQVLEQGDEDTTNHRYNLALAPATAVADVRVATRARAVRGSRDRSFGVAARWRDGDSYYLARCNTSGWGSNVRLYRFTAGVREELASTEVEAVPGTWYDLALEVRGDRLIAIFAGKQVLEVHDGALTGAGRVGVWTKSESVSQFADLTVTPLGAP